MLDHLLELIVIMPVFNEQASIRKVVTEWMQEIETWTEHFHFLVIDDGSTDQTLNLLRRLQAQYNSKLEVISRENRGHGQSCLQGYRMAMERNIPWILQIDSDGQCDPQYFFRFWRIKDSYDVVYGVRRKRDDGWRRVLASQILKGSLLVTQGVLCADANVPYRLMRSSALSDVLPRIPEDFCLANVALAVLLRKDKSVKHGKVSIRFRERYGGEPSVRLGKFGSKAFELHQQLNRLHKNSWENTV